ncbi:sensor histidine kinase [Streptomyces sp. enrichment culture]|uniref:sensor histidine kinase n=1 Tax=Streptomyces sp. enrichment culture TaxID=1795815 RepID=UPI003F554200
MSAKNGALPSYASLPAAAATRLRLLWSWWEARPVAARNREFALVLVVLAFTPPLSRIGAQFGDLAVHGASVVSVLLTLGLTLPLAVRTRWPAACLAVVGASFALHQSLGCPPTIGTVGLYIALYSAGAHQRRVRWAAPLAATGGYVLFCVALHALGSPAGLVDYLLYYLVVMVAWGLGALVRRQRAQEAARRHLSAQVAIAAERSRMAKELHDVVTHHVTAMVVQAGAAQYLTESPDRMADSLNAINGSGRRALAELRFLLGVLEATGDSEPQEPQESQESQESQEPQERQQPQERPGMPGRVSDLVEQIRAGGQPVELIEEGIPPALSVGARLAVYRVVQESLTNAVKYAAGHRTLVRLAHTPDWTEVEVTTMGDADDTAESAALRDGGPHISGGRGLAGLQERVEMLGGEFTAGFRAGGGFRVSAHLPAGCGA